MDAELKEKILELYQQFVAEDKTKTDRLDRWRNLEPESAEFISIIIRSQQSKNVLEIGTSNGFSTLWLADAVKSTNGKLISIEIEKRRTLIAQHNLAKFDLTRYAELITADAKDYIAQSPAIFDTIFLDAERKYYAEYWPYLKNILQKSGAILLVDNVISHKDEVERFIKLVSNDGDFMSATLSIGAGILLVTKQ